MTRRKYRFKDRAEAEAAFERAESRYWAVARILSTYVWRKAPEGVFKMRLGTHTIIASPSLSGIHDVVMVFHPVGQRPSVDVIDDLDATLRGYHLNFRNRENVAVFDLMNKAQFWLREVEREVVGT